MSFDPITNTPLTFENWIQYKDSITNDKSYDEYQTYLKNWYNGKTLKNKLKKGQLKEDYIQLLKDLNFLFGKNEKDKFLKELDYANEEELILAIPFFARKLKEIAKVLSTKREVTKQAKIRYSHIGSNIGLENLLYEYVLKSFTKKENSLTEVPTEAFGTIFPNLSSIKDNFSIEVEELHDTGIYHDSDPSVDIKLYTDFSSITSNNDFSDLSENEILTLISSRFLPKAANNNLSKVLQEFLVNDSPSNSQANVFLNKVSANQKYLGTKMFGLTATKISDTKKNDQFLSLSFTTGNNWFLWPSGNKVLNNNVYQNLLKPIAINSSAFIESSATAGKTYLESDLIFTDKNGVVEGAWLKDAYTAESTDIMVATIAGGETREFIFPYCGFTITNKGSFFKEFSIKDDHKKEFNVLDVNQQQLILNDYYTKTVPSSASNPVYLNQTNLVDSGAYAEKYSNNSDNITRRKNTPINQIDSDSLIDDLEKAFLYKFTKTDIPITKGSSNILWPVTVIKEEDIISLNYQKKDCASIALSSINPSFDFTGAVAGFDFNSADVVYKLDNRFGEQLEAAWLLGESIHNLNTQNNQLSAYGTDTNFLSAKRCSLYIDGPVQPALSLRVESSKKESFVWCDVDTLADDVFKFISHSPDCAFGKQDNDFSINPSGNTKTKNWTECTCKSVQYSPVGNKGNNVMDNNGVADYLFVDTDGLGDNFTINTWTDSRNLTPFNSPQFSFFQLASSSPINVGWGEGQWKTGNGNPMILKTGKRYTYYRSSLRNNTPKNKPPYFVASYPYRTLTSNTTAIQTMVPYWAKAVKDVSGEWVGLKEPSTLILNAGDYLEYNHRTSIDYTSENNSNDFKQNSISFTINTPLSGWNNKAEAKPFWAKVYSVIDIPNRFTKQTSDFGGQIRFFDDYVPIHQPEVSNMVLNNKDFIRYKRNESKSLKWNEPLTFVYTISAKSWNRLDFSSVSASNLSGILKNEISDIVFSASNEPSQMLLESYSGFKAAEYNYFARNPFVYKENLFYIKNPDTTIYNLSSAVLIDPVDPYLNLDNRFYPTVANISFPNNSKTTKEIGEYLLPEKLGTSFYRGFGYTIQITEDGVTKVLSLSAEPTFLDIDKYGPRNRGLTKKDQISPVEIIDIDNNWVFEPHVSSEKRGFVQETRSNQKMIPYQSNFEIEGKNNLGISRQDDEFSFWTSSENPLWKEDSKYPLNYRKELLDSSFFSRIEKLLVDKGQIEKWKTDLFGNEFVHFKSSPAIPSVSATVVLSPVIHKDFCPIIEEVSGNSLATQNGGYEFSLERCLPLEFYLVQELCPFPLFTEVGSNFIEIDNLIV